MLKCQYCSNEYSKYGIKRHENSCVKNPNLEEIKKTDPWHLAMNAKKGSGQNQWTKAKKTGQPYILSEESRKRMSKASSGRKHTDETKQLISKKRKEFLEQNPDMVPYKLNHYSKGQSYAEVYWQGILDSNGINYIAEYGISLYSLDFAIVDKKIDLEIDGDQHYLDERIVESDKRRTEYLESEGWTVIRIKWSDYQKLERNKKEQYVNNILEQIMGP